MSKTSSPPAILGGKPAVTLEQGPATRWPVVTAADEAAVLRVLRSGQLSVNPEVAALEADIRRWLDVPFALCHNNATGALHASMHALDVGAGDEVIVPSATWWASVMPVLHMGGVPVFAETEPECIGLDPQDVEARITDRTRAIVVVHLFGVPSRIDELLDVARRHGLAVVEDASHAHGATYHGRKVGTLGDIGVFSMQANKLLPSAEGGILVTADSEIHEKVIRYGHYERLLPLAESPNRRFAATGFGHKFRMSPLSAALARSQLGRLEEHNEVRSRNCVQLSHRLEELGCFETFLAPKGGGREGVERVYFEFLVRYDGDRTGLPIRDLVAALQAEGVQAGAPRYPLLHQQPVFTEGTWRTIARITEAQNPRSYDPADLPRTIANNGLMLKLPVFSQPAPELVEQYATAFERVLANTDQIPRNTDSTD